MRNSLREHLQVQHLLQEDLEDEIDGYDSRVKSQIDKEREREMARLAEALALIGLYEADGISPEEVFDILSDLMKKKKKRTR